jgi:DNA repair protein RecO (recombination protein O)
MINNAWVIHKSWSGETSARVVFFTRDHGVVHCFYKGGRTPKKQALLQAFIPLWLDINIRGDAYFVHRLEIAAAPIALEGKNLFAGLYMNELLFYALKPQDPSDTLYSAYLLSLEALMMASDRYAIERVLRRFEWILLTACGYSISLTHDARTQRPIDKGSLYRFVEGEGFVLAEVGISGAHILALSEGALDDLSILHVAKKIMRSAIVHMLDGKPIQARALYMQEY